MKSKSRDATPPTAVLARIRALLELPRRAEDGDRGAATPPLADLLRRTRQQLLRCAREASLKGIHRLTKAELARRVREEIRRLAAVAQPPASAEVSGLSQPAAPTEVPRPSQPAASAEVSGPSQPPAPAEVSGPSQPAASAEAPRTFDLGPAPEVLDGRPAHIPWGYGQDRVTAMAVDPDRLYVYWEVTDEALDRARSALGPGGGDAWLNLRVYDVTDRIFDGTNAHAYFDHAVARTDRQWFFSIGRPSSTVVVEVGLKSNEGYFARVARSGRTDFPRREAAPPGPVEWLTVLTATGEVGEPIEDGHESPAVISGGAWPGGHHEPAPRGDIGPTRQSQWVDREESVVTAREWHEWVRERASEWEGPIVHTAWEAGPYTYPVEPPLPVEERYQGAVTVQVVGGRVRVVYGPWQVVIRGLGAWGERRVLGVWQIHRTWLTSAGAAVQAESRHLRAPGGSEEVIPGASELAWRAASELRLGGASEVYLLGASELRYGGASERSYVGASEWRYGGASERFSAGASERLYAGASEWRERGGSELVHRGASERLYPGASEHAWAGASENGPRYPAVPSDG